MSRALRRALLRGALPSLLALITLPFDAGAAPGVVFFALVGTVLLLAERALVSSRHEYLGAFTLAGLGAFLYAAAGIQSVYAHGVVHTGTLEGGLRAVSGACKWLLAVGPDGHRTTLAGALFCSGCAGVSHASVVFSESEARWGWGRSPHREVVFLLLGSMVIGAVVGPCTEGFESGGLFAAFALIFVTPVVTVSAEAAFGALTKTCDRIEAALWPGHRPEVST